MPRRKATVLKVKKEVPLRARGSLAKKAEKAHRQRKDLERQMDD